MAVFKIFPEKTATLYSQYPEMNTGRDEILELGSYSVGTDSFVNRALIQFDLSEITDVLETFVSSSTRPATSFSASLRLSLASANEVPDSYTIEAHPVYVPGATLTTWVAGNGKHNDTPKNSSGVSWVFTQSSGSNNWTSDSIAGETVTSYSSSEPGGGAWYTDTPGYVFNMYQSHTVNSTHDLNINVTEGVKAQYDGSIDNAGFLLKISGSAEFAAYSNSRQLSLRYFSHLTHTIYPPCLEIKWDDSQYLSGLTTITDPNASIRLKNNRGEYTNQGKQRFELNVRPKYPTRTFATSSNYLTNFRLPAASYWGLRDENTHEMVVDFDTLFTKISTSTSSSYFDIYMGGLEPERHYRVLTKTEIGGSTTIVDEGQVFKIVRNG
tara:strand:- start:19065 stop:20210 length:1146 start_codon:yes stop_codon:yes gene_type:complete